MLLLYRSFKYNWLSLFQTLFKQAHFQILSNVSSDTVDNLLNDVLAQLLWLHLLTYKVFDSDDRLPVAFMFQYFISENKTLHQQVLIPLPAGWPGCFVLSLHVILLLLLWVSFWGYISVPSCWIASCDRCPWCYPASVSLVEQHMNKLSTSCSCCRMRELAERQVNHFQVNHSNDLISLHVETYHMRWVWTSRLAPNKRNKHPLKKHKSGSLILESRVHWSSLWGDMSLLSVWDLLFNSYITPIRTGCLKPQLITALARADRRATHCFLIKSKQIKND